MLMTNNRWAHGLATNHILIIALCSASVLVMCGCPRSPSTTTAVAAGHEWVQFTSRSAGFTASYPSIPKDETEPDGQAHVYKLSYANAAKNQSDAHFFAVRYDPAPDLTMPLTSRVAAIRENMHATNVSVSDIEVDGQKGIEVSCEEVRHDTRYTSRIRMFYVNRALYLVNAVMVTGPDGQADVDRFFASFHFLPDAAP
jgi:hypothetical protein